MAKKILKKESKLDKNSNVDLAPIRLSWSVDWHMESADQHMASVDRHFQSTDWPKSSTWPEDPHKLR